MSRQIRWNKIRFSFSKTLYTGEYVLNPMPLALMATLLGVFISPSVAVQCGTFTALITLSRMMQTLIMARATSTRAELITLFCVPIQDLLQFAAQFVPYFSRRVSWRGHSARLGPGTLMILEGNEVVAAA